MTTLDTRRIRRMVVQVGALAMICNALLVGLAGNVMAASPARPIKIVAFGDSLTAGYGLTAADAFPAKLQKALAAKGRHVELINAGVSGDTTAAGLDRIAWAVPPDADGVIVELGANDVLRGLDPAAARANLDRILATLAAQKAELLIAGMKAPRNLPPSYVAAFDSIYPDLAEKHRALLYPFFIEKIAMNASLNLADGMHPNPKGVDAIVADILPKVEELIQRIEKRRDGS